jgi:hypothetical protein
MPETFRNLEEEGLEEEMRVWERIIWAHVLRQEVADPNGGQMIMKKR